MHKFAFAQIAFVPHFKGSTRLNLCRDKATDWQETLSSTAVDGSQDKPFPAGVSATCPM